MAEQRYTVHVTYPKSFYIERLPKGQTLEVRITWRVNSRGITRHIQSGKTQPAMGPSLISAELVTPSEDRQQRPTREKVLDRQIDLQF